jgi:hypothetical protein
MKLSWQVTGIREDPRADAHRIKVEQDKLAKERGHYLNPELNDQLEEIRISHLSLQKTRRMEEEEARFNQDL